MKGVIKVGSLTATGSSDRRSPVCSAGSLALSIMSSVSAMVTIGPRVYYAMAQERAFFPIAARVHEKYRTPVVAIIAQGHLRRRDDANALPAAVYYVGMTLELHRDARGRLRLHLPAAAPRLAEVQVVSFAYPLVPALFVITVLDDHLRVDTPDPRFGRGNSYGPARGVDLSLPDSR